MSTTQDGLAMATASWLLAAEYHDSILHEPVSETSEVSTAKAVPAAHACPQEWMATAIDSERHAPLAMKQRHPITVPLRYENPQTGDSTAAPVRVAEAQRCATTPSNRHPNHGNTPG
jgi:hypothetical protein